MFRSWKLIGMWKYKIIRDHSASLRLLSEMLHKTANVVQRSISYRFIALRYIVELFVLFYLW